jgi:hypothetical protein
LIAKSRLRIAQGVGVFLIDVMKNELNQDCAESHVCATMQKNIFILKVVRGKYRGGALRNLDQSSLNSFSRLSPPKHVNLRKHAIPAQS